MLADAGSPKAFDALIDIAGKSRGQTRVSALEMLAQSHPGDPAVGQLLADSLFSGRRDESHVRRDRARPDRHRGRAPGARRRAHRQGQGARGGRRRRARPGRPDRQREDRAARRRRRSNPQVKMQVMNQLVQAGAPEGLRLAEEMLERQGRRAARARRCGRSPNRAPPRRKRLIERALDSKEPSDRRSRRSRRSRRTPTTGRPTRCCASRAISDPQVRAIGAVDARPGRLGARAAGDPRRDAHRQARGARRRDQRPRADGRRRAPAQQLAHADARPRSARSRRPRSTRPTTAAPRSTRRSRRSSTTRTPTPKMRAVAANQLRARGTELDAATEQQGHRSSPARRSEYGGYGYGGYGTDRRDARRAATSID